MSGEKEKKNEERKRQTKPKNKNVKNRIKQNAYYDNDEGGKGEVYRNSSVGWKEESAEKSWKIEMFGSCEIKQQKPKKKIKH